MRLTQLLRAFSLPQRPGIDTAPSGRSYLSTESSRTECQECGKFSLASHETRAQLVRHVALKAFFEGDPKMLRSSIFYLRFTIRLKASFCPIAAWFRSISIVNMLLRIGRCVLLDWIR